MKRVTKPATLATLLMLPGVAFGQQGMLQNIEPYVGLGVGSSSHDVQGDDNDTGFKIFGGGLLNPNFGAELSYVDLGQFQEVGNPLLGTLTSRIEASAWALHGIGRLPLMNNQASVFGKVGVALAQVEANNTDDNSFDLAYGIGASYDFQKNLGVRAEWERYALGNNDALLDESDFDLFSASLVVRFQ
jgi:OOP family OmpA-OmpF porin